MKQHTTLFIGLLFTVFLYSCVSDVEVDSFSIEKELVINALITPDSLLSIELSQTKVIPGKGNTYSTINDATVKLYEDDVEIETLHYVKTDNDSASVYSSTSVYPQIGKTYRVEASNSGNETVSCETIIPSPVKIISVDTSFSNSYEVKIKITFKDPPEVENYYRIVVHETYGRFITTWNDEKDDYDTTGIAVYDTYVNDWSLESDDPLLSNADDADDYLFGGADNLFNIFTGELIDGQEYTIDFSFYVGYSKPERLETDKGEFYQMKIELQSLSYDEYTYMLSYTNYDWNDGDFSLTEPIQVYSNVENGTGIFAGHSIDSHVLSVGEYPMEGINYQLQ